MKRKNIEDIPFDLPLKIKAFCKGARLFDSSCSDAAKVYFIDRDGGYYLKINKPDTLLIEAEMNRYFFKKGLGPEVIAYSKNESFDFLLTAAVRGEDCTHEIYLSDPKRLTDILANTLRTLHETDFSDCPIADRNTDYSALAEKNYHSGNYDKANVPLCFSSADDAYRFFARGKEKLKKEVLLHGDYCLPNILLNDWKFSGFIDLGNGGVGDRHIDIFWCTWSLCYNLKTDKYRERFFDAYGRDNIDEERLLIVEAAETFG